MLLGMNRTANAGDSSPGSEYLAAAVIKDSIIPALTCMDRPKGVRAPPKRLAPLPRSTKKRRDDDYDRDDVKDSAQFGSSHLGFKAVCQLGKVPMAKANPTKVGKGNPLFRTDPNREYLKYEDFERSKFVIRHLRSFEEVYKLPHAEGQNPPPPPPAPACDGVAWFGSCYYYGNAGFSTVSDGGGMTLSIDKPQYVNTGGSGHTLNEIAVQGGDNNRNIVELGWLVSNEQEGNSNPHIFVYHWINGAETCYDGCGWQQWSNTYHPGMDLGSAVGKKVYVGYVFYQGNWWAWFDNQWMGYFPGTEWNGQYTKTSLIQWFGEVASANGIPPKTQMGDGLLSVSPSAASMATLCDVDAKDWICWYRDKQALSQTVPKYYDIGRVGYGATRYGGPGQ